MSTGDYAGVGPSGPRAGFWRRFAAVLLDGIVLGSLTTIFYALLKSGGYALGIIIALAYYSYFEGTPRGQTLGKQVVGIRVIDVTTGQSIGHSRAAIRYVSSILSAIVIYLGYLWMLWDGERQTWHDKFASSLVVPVSAYPVR